MTSIASAGPQGLDVGRSRSLGALAAVNFFLADVRDGLGPFLGIFLVGKGWGADTIGYVMTIGGIAGMLATTPLGALADASRSKRLIVGICSVLVIVASLAILVSPGLVVVAASQIATGIAGAAIGPALAGLTLGLVGQRGLAPQLGRNEAWNHAGNVGAAVGAGFFGYEFGLTAVFVLMTAMAAGSLAAVAMIRESDIDHDTARGLNGPGSDGEQAAPAAFATLWRSTPLLILAATLMLFHFGNGAMLPLLGQQVAAAAQASGQSVMDAATGTGSAIERFLVDPVSYTAATVVIAQLTMIPIALLAAGVAGRQGYFLLLVAALVALPVRGLIAGLWPSPYALIPVQMLDGVGAGLLGVAVPGLVARILNGTGHVNAGLGAVMTVQGIGASLSPAIAGVLVKNYGYSSAYLVLSGFALCGLAIWLVSLRRVASACAAPTR